MHNNPLVTIYIPTYNREALLQRAIDSVLSQTYDNLELIIVDDCSSDGTAPYLERLARQYNWIRSLRNPDNAGACVSRNRAIEAAQGQFITGLDDDDYFLPTRIADFVAHWGQRRAGSVALTSARRKILPDGSEIDLPGKDTVGVKDMYLRNLAGSQAFLETATARQLGGFDPQLKAWQDYDFLFRLAQLGTIENLPVASYVVDASHPHERISTRNYRKVAAACEYFIDKHGISGRQAVQVRSQLLVYRFSYPEAVAFLLRFIARGDIAGVKAVIRRFQRSRSSS